MQPIDKLRLALSNRNVIPVVGAGVSKGAASLPSWPDLLEKGVAYIDKNRKELKVLKKQTNELVRMGRKAKLIEAFDELQTLLGGAPDSDYYQAFLSSQFGRPKVTNAATLEALKLIDARVIVTTNYDLLLRDHQVVPDAEIVTWQDPQEIFSLLRGGKGIVHLHGRYDLPETVILSQSDYKRIVGGPEVTQAVARALFYSGVLLFVGSSVDGVTDPHLGEILKEFSRLQGPLVEGTMPHFMLVKGYDDVQRAKLRKQGIEPISFGDEFDDLPKFLNSLAQQQKVFIHSNNIRDRIHSLRVASNRSDILSDVKTFVNEVIYPGRKVRLAFAEKMEENGRTILCTKHLFPEKATHNRFSYPQTLAAWALIEGKIFEYRPDSNCLDHACDFKLLRSLKKYQRVRNALLATDPEADPILSDYLKPEEIISKTKDETLKLSDLYQHWVGRQPSPHYVQFISVPVPVVEEIVGQKEPPEYGVLNIDTAESEPLLTEEVVPLLKLASDMITLGFEIVDQKSEAKPGGTK